MVRYLEDHPADTTSGAGLQCSESKSDTIDLPDTMWVNNYFQLDLKNYFSDPRGHYIISFGYPTYKNSEGRPIYDRMYANVTNLAVGEKKVDWTKYDTLT